MNHKETETNQQDLILGEEVILSESSREKKLDEQLGTEAHSQVDEIELDIEKETSDDNWKSVIEPNHRSTINFIETLSKASKFITEKTNLLLTRLRADNKSLLIGLSAVCIISIVSTLTVSNFVSNSRLSNDNIYYEWSYSQSYYPGYEDYSSYPNQFHYSDQIQSSSMNPEEILQEIIDQIRESIEQSSSNIQQNQRDAAMREISENLIEF